MTTNDNTSPRAGLDLDALTKRARRVYPKRGWDGGEAERALPVVTEDVPALVAEVIRLRTLRDDIADAFDGLVMKVWRATGETHEPPSDVAALLARVADDHKALVGFRRAMLDVHEALDGVRPEPDFDMPAELGSYACDEVARLQESRDALRAEVRQLRAAALHRRREGAEAMREACAKAIDARASQSETTRERYSSEDDRYGEALAVSCACEDLASALRALPLPGGES